MHPRSVVAKTEESAILNATRLTNCYRKALISLNQVTQSDHRVRQRIISPCNFFTGAGCQKSFVQYSPTSAPEMPRCNFQPEEYKVR